MTASASWSIIWNGFCFSSCYHVTYGVTVAGRSIAAHGVTAAAAEPIHLAVALGASAWPSPGSQLTLNPTPGTVAIAARLVDPSCVGLTSVRVAWPRLVSLAPGTIDEAFRGE